MPVRVKICGITSAADADSAVSAGAWAVGFNFFRGSPRHIEPSLAGQIADSLPASVVRVGVFVNESRAFIESVCERARLTMLQFHGDEPPPFCSGWRLPTVKALRLRDGESLALVHSYAVDFILADAYVEGAFGGTGRRVDRRLLAELDRGRLILAGGLTPENVTEAVQQAQPYAVDVASGVENSPGKKDAALIRRFVQNANLA